MTITDFFIKLGAPLANPQWSWGAVGDDGTVFLRVWQDEELKRDGRFYMRITKHEGRASQPGRPAYAERLRHIAQIRGGADCFLVICIAASAESKPRNVKDFINDAVFQAGEIIEHEGNSWIERLRRVPVTQFATAG